MTKPIHPLPAEPTAQAIYEWITLLFYPNDLLTGDLDEWVYNLIGHYDNQFSDDPNWYSENDTDMKDQLRDEVLDLLDNYCNEAHSN